MSLDAGDRDKKVMFQRTGEPVDDGYTTQPGAWANLCPAYAAISFGTGQERREAAQESASLPATFSVLSNSRTRTLSVVDRICYPISDPDPSKWPAWDITSVVPSRVLNEGIDVTAVRAAQ